MSISGDIECQRQGKHWYVAQLLLKNGSNPNQTRAFDGWFPLLWASHEGELKMVQILLKRGANVNQATKSNKVTALFSALQNGHVDVAETLLSESANPNAIRKSDGATPLVLAITHITSGANAKMVALLLKHGAKVNQRGRLTEATAEAEKRSEGVVHTTGTSAMMVAIRNGQLEIASLLLTAGANPDVRDGESGHTALSLALNENHIDIAGQ